ncbi:MAG TPA: SAM-dependent methyltransferase [Streptosporangiaceae bacterium]
MASGPIVLAHARALLTSSPEGATTYIEADLRDTGKILQQAAQLLDFSQPVAVMLVGVLHCILDADDPAGIVVRLLNAVMDSGVTLRSHAEVSRFLAGVNLTDPGLVQLHRWRPGPAGPVPAHELVNYGAVGVKP